MTASTATTTDLPAILGGSPAVTLDQKAAFRWPVITEEDEQAVLGVLRTGELSINPIVFELENDYRQWLGMKHAVSHNNGTGAIHAALHAFDLQPGDEVIVQSATWWASVMPVLHHGAVPVFAECEFETAGLDPADVESKITSRTKAMIVVHLFGMPSKMDELLAIAKKHNLKVLEDASHAHGATYRGKKVGTLGDAAVFSMQANKLVPSAEGGMFLTNDDEMFEKVLRYAHYERLIPMKESPNRRFAATSFGHKFRMSPLSAAVARVQLKHLNQRNAKRNANCIALAERLDSMGCFSTFTAPNDVERVYFEFLIGYEPEAGGLPIGALTKALQAEGAMVGAPRYPLVHQQPMFTEGRWKQIARIPNDHPAAQRSYDPTDLPRTIAGNARLLKLPSFPNAGLDLVDQYEQAFAKVLAHADQIARESS